jgi:hypothetical protein
MGHFSVTILTSTGSVVSDIQHRQVAEIQIRATILNDFTAFGIPRTVTLG